MRRLFPSGTTREGKADLLSAAEFEWHQDANEYRCPEGHALRSDSRQLKNIRDHIIKTDTIVYRSSAKDCANCPAKQSCCPNMPIRKIARSIYESSRDVARSLASTRRSRRRLSVECLLLTVPSSRAAAVQIGTAYSQY